MINVVTGDILDILERRDKATIKDHFIVNYSLQERKCVETVTIDMNAGYESVIKELFPNANIIIDRFHLVQLNNRSMNKTRILVMNQLRPSDGEDMKKYRRLKRYWKLLLKKESDLSTVEYKYYYLFGQRTEKSIVEEILEYDAAILKANYEALGACLNSPVSSEITGYMETNLKTLRKHLPFIENSFSYPYNNGRIEGNDNKIKVLNRVAYGYRNFWNYKNRILLHFKLKPLTVRQDQGQSPVEVA